MEKNERKVSGHTKWNSLILGICTVTEKKISEPLSSNRQQKKKIYSKTNRIEGNIEEKWIHLGNGGINPR